MKGLLIVCTQVVFSSASELNHDSFHAVDKSSIHAALSLSQAFGDQVKSPAMCPMCWVWLGWSSALSRAGCTMLWFRFVTKTVLITHRCFSCCQMVLTQNQGCLFLTLPPQQVVWDGQDAGRAHGHESWLQQARIFHAIEPSGSAAKLRNRGSSETGQAEVYWWEAVTTFAPLALLLPRPHVSPLLIPLQSTSIM